MCMEYLEQSEGEWNNPNIESKILNISVSGFAPKFRGGCIGIIPNVIARNNIFPNVISNVDSINRFLILNEDDDNYWDNVNLTLDELKDYRDVLLSLSGMVNVKIDYIKAISKTTYTPNKKKFFNTNHSRNKFEVNLTDRGKTTSPLVSIVNSSNDFKDSFDISWAKVRLDMINKMLIELNLN